MNGGSTSNRTPPHRQLPRMIMSAYFAIQTFFGSVKNLNASSPPSLPTPLCFMPPKGTRKSRTSQQFTQTVPVLIRSATRDRQTGDDRRRKEIPVTTALVRRLRARTTECDLAAFFLREIDVELDFL